MRKVTGISKTLLAATLLFISGCVDEAARGDAKAAKDAEAPQRRDRLTEEYRLNKLEKSGNTVFLFPVKRELETKQIQGRYGNFCFMTDALVDPWFVVDTARHNHWRYRWRGNYGPAAGTGSATASPEILIVADSRKLDIPFYKIELKRPVDYKFVSPFQEFVYVWIESIGPDFDKDEYFKRISKYSSRTKRPTSEHPPRLTEIEYNFSGYEKPPLKAYFRESKSGGGENFLLMNEELTVAIHSATKTEEGATTTFTSGLQPTAGFYKTPTMRGAFLHKSGKVVVNFEASLLALPQSPRLFDIADTVVSSLIADCE